MSWEKAAFEGLNKTNTSAEHQQANQKQKPIEIYVFIDPLCPECWSLEPYLKKLKIEHGNLFTIRQIISGCLHTLNKDVFDKPRKLKDIWEKTASRTGMSCDGDIWTENPISSPFLASLAVKAAELQGKRAGRTFLRKVQESLFLFKQNIADEAILLQCAEKAQIDVEEFKQDLYSTSARKAFQCDLKLTKEMEVDYIPTIVFFNQHANQHGIKISGLYPYDIYKRVLKQILNEDLKPKKTPNLEDFLAQYDIIGTKEIATVFEWSTAKTEKEMKKLLLQQTVEKIPVKYGSFWRYCGSK